MRFVAPFVSFSRTIGASMRREPFTWLLIAGLVAVIAYTLVRSLRRREGWLNQKEYDKWKSYPRGYQPGGLKNYDDAMNGKLGGDVQKAAQWATREVAKRCSKGGARLDLLMSANPKIREFQDSTNKLKELCTKQERAKNTQVSFADTSTKESTKCNEYCAEAGFQQKYWCKHPSKADHCCNKDKGKGECADLKLMASKKELDAKDKLAAERNKLDAKAAEDRNTYEMTGDSILYVSQLKNGKCPDGTRTIANRSSRSSVDKCGVLKGQKDKADKALQADGAAPASDGNNNMGCSTDGTDDASVWKGPMNNPPQPADVCCQGWGCGLSAQPGLRTQGKQFKWCKCCEGAPNSRGNCPGRGKTECDGC